jgi:hypothetical protein
VGPTPSLFSAKNEPNHFFNQRLNSSEWPNYCDHSVTSADVRLASAIRIEKTAAEVANFKWQIGFTIVRIRMASGVLAVPPGRTVTTAAAIVPHFENGRVNNVHLSAFLTLTNGFLCEMTSKV